MRRIPTDIVGNTFAIIVNREQALLVAPSEQVFTQFEGRFTLNRKHQGCLPLPVAVAIVFAQ